MGEIPVKTNSHGTLCSEVPRQSLPLGRGHEHVTCG